MGALSSWLDRDHASALGGDVASGLDEDLASGRCCY